MGGRRIDQFDPPADVLVDQDGVTVYEGRGDAAIRRIERGFGRFERSLRVPPGLEPDAIQARLVDRVLELRIPRPESMKPHRIPIQTSDGASRSIEG
jgi:HSP20 family molecular chaperone IbpA